MHRVELKDIHSVVSIFIIFSFLMHRVELKDILNTLTTPFLFQFLMHRVELKDIWKEEEEVFYRTVPNAPCGVERLLGAKSPLTVAFVPNAPCGVERSI